MVEFINGLTIIVPFCFDYPVINKNLTDLHLETNE